MGEFDRFPLTYIMEAADDISYCVADLEDAVEKSIFTVEQLYQHLIQEWGEVVPGDLFDKTVASAFRKIDRGARAARKISSSCICGCLPWRGWCRTRRSALSTIWTRSIRAVSIRRCWRTPARRTGC